MILCAISEFLAIRNPFVTDQYGGFCEHMNTKVTLPDADVPDVVDPVDDPDADAAAAAAAAEAEAAANARRL